MESKMVAYKLNEEKMFCDISDNIAIVINSETGIYYGMNGFGTEVFEKIIGGATLESILTALKALAKAPTDIEKRLNAFVEKLTENDIIIKSTTKSALKISLDGKIATTDKFVLEFLEYSDAQELLLADPIHDIKDETGWQPIMDAKETDKKKLKSKKEKEAIVRGEATKTTAVKNSKNTVVKVAKNVPAKKPVAKPNKKVQK
jgi:hypothetical protein